MRHARHHNPLVKRLSAVCGDPYKRWVQGEIIKRGYSHRIPWNVPHGTVQAYIYRDAWIAKCPTESCHGAVIVDDEEPVFFCPDCLSADNDGHPYSVEFPHKEEAEALMAMRYNPQSRNFLPGETIEDLIEEQLEHGEFEHGIHG